MTICLCQKSLRVLSTVYITTGQSCPILCPFTISDAHARFGKSRGHSLGSLCTGGRLPSATARCLQGRQHVESDCSSEAFPRRSGASLQEVCPQRYLGPLFLGMPLRSAYVTDTHIDSDTPGDLMCSRTEEYFPCKY